MTTVRGENIETITEKVFFKTENDLTTTHNNSEDAKETTPKPRQYEVHEDLTEIITTQSTPLLPVHTTTELVDEKYLKVIPLNPKDTPHLDEDVYNKLEQLTASSRDLNDIHNEDLITSYGNNGNDIEDSHTDGAVIVTKKPEFLEKNTKKEAYLEKKDLYDKKIKNEQTATSSFTEVKPVTEGFSFTGFSRCASGQFQCVNGTSIKDGSYCIPKSDRCDSVDHCSDASDETDCVKEGCPNNFQV